MCRFSYEDLWLYDETNILKSNHSKLSILTVTRVLIFGGMSTIYFAVSNRNLEYSVVLEEFV